MVSRTVSKQTNHVENDVTGDSTVCAVSYFLGTLKEQPHSHLPLLKAIEESFDETN